MSTPRRAKGGTAAAVPPRAAGPHRATRVPWLLLPGLLLAVALAYQPAWHGGLLWDDGKHMTAPALRSLDGLWRIWFEPGATQQYYPLTHTAFWLQHWLWGEATTGYHLVSIALHAVSAFLVALVLRALGLGLPAAALAAGVFALHPVHVESVAWMTELKNTLSGALALGSGLAYLAFDRSRGRRHYALALGLFVLALLGKTVTAVLPPVLLVAVWWRRGGLAWRRDVAPLLPWLLLGAAAGLTTAWVERTMIGAQGGEFELSAPQRVLIAGRVPWFYLEKLLWPAGLTFVYPRWNVDPGSWPLWLYPLALLSLGAALWLVRRRARGPLAVFLAFCLLLFPVAGFLNVFPFRYSFVADHFQYLASVPAIALAAAALASAGRLIGRRARAVLPMAAGALCLLLAVLTWQQSHQYVSAEALYEATLRRNPAAWMAHVNLGIVKLEGRVPEAMEHFREALRLKPDLPEAHYDMGLAMHRSGRFEEAVGHYREALSLQAELPAVWDNLSDALRRLGRPTEAVAAGVEAVRLDPNLATARANLGRALLAAGRAPEASAHLAEALRLSPGTADVHYGLATALHAAGRLAEARAHYLQALGLDPAHADAHANLGAVLQAEGRIAEAVAEFDAALRLRPNHADALYYRGNALQQLGRLDEAVASYRAALRARPDDAAVSNNLGVALEALGRFADAAAAYEEALRLRPDLAQARTNLERVRQAVRRTTR